MIDFSKHLKKNKDMAKKSLEPIPLDKLEDMFQPGTTVPCVEGYLVKLHKEESGEGQYGPWTKTGGVLQDVNDQSVEISISFWGKEEALIPQTAWKKKIRIESKAGQKGSSGIQMGEYNDKPQLKITAAAIITWPDGEPKAGKPKGESGASSGAQGSDGGSSRRPQNEEIDADDEPFEERVEGWLKAFSQVCEAAGHKPEEVMEKFSASDLKEITTGLAASFKAKFGMHRRIHFRDGSPKGAGSVSGDEGAGEKEEGSTRIPKWQDVIHPKANKPLGKLEKDQIRKGIAWALTTESDKLETKRLIAAFRMAAAEKSITAQTLVEEAVAADKECTDEKSDAYAHTQYGCAWADLTEENFLHMLKSLEKVKEAIATTEAEENPPF